MRTINFGKNQRLFQIKPIKTADFRFLQFGKNKGKRHTLYKFQTLQVVPELLWTLNCSKLKTLSALIKK
jgi:hypothetical protein